MSNGLPVDAVALREEVKAKLAIGHARFSQTYPCLIQHGGVDVDGEDVICYSGQRSREQSVATTEVNYDHSALHAHFGENLPRIRPQHLPTSRHRAFAVAGKSRSSCGSSAHG